MSLLAPLGGAGVGLVWGWQLAASLPLLGVVRSAAGTAALAAGVGLVAGYVPLGCSVLAGVAAFAAHRWWRGRLMRRYRPVVGPGQVR